MLPTAHVELDVPKTPAQNPAPSAATPRVLHVSEPAVFHIHGLAGFKHVTPQLTVGNQGSNPEKPPQPILPSA